MAALPAIAFTGCALVVYSYVLYPVLLLALASVFQALKDIGFFFLKTERRAARPAMDALPHVAVLIAAFNEQRHVIARVRNLLELDYPPDRLTIHVGSDGSKDATASLLESIRDPRVHVTCWSENRGKASVLNDLVQMSRADILVFSDANTHFRPDAVTRLVGHFADPAVGGVSGELRLASRGTDNQDGLFWRVEQALKFLESRIGGSLGANGAIYAIRRELWRPLAPDTICDDFVVGMRVASARRRFLYEPSAVAEEEIPDTIGEEVDRRRRIGIGNYQSLFRNPEFLLATPWIVKFTYLSHKVLRWASPHLLILSFAAAALLALRGDPFWAAVTVAAAAITALLATVYAISGRRGGTPALLRVPVFLFALNWALLAASWKFATGHHKGSWSRSGR
jgi:cellulose synthase/poly-beta-1,6-N-acetylglucosamine synthase-like glycosyltransferase